jgi:hypothetical protein
MAVTHPESPPAARPSRRRWLWGLLALPLVVVGACLWFTEPLEPPPSEAPPAVVHLAARPPAAEPPAEEASPAWPEGRLEGEPAKRLLLEVLKADRRRLEGVAGYTATFRKQERVKGKLGPLQTLAMKVRHRPFSVYLKFLAPKAGKEVVYAQGRHEDKVIAHNGDWTRRLIPRLAVKPTDPLALADSRHPITDAGLLNLVDKLIFFRELDLTDPEAVTVLDRTTDAEGQVWLRSWHSHPHYNGQRPFARVEVLYDPETLLPMSITNYDWPAPGHSGDLLLAEHYDYDDLTLDAALSDRDFDPANPDYAFTRY